MFSEKTWERKTEALAVRKKKEVKPKKSAGKMGLMLNGKEGIQALGEE